MIAFKSCLRCHGDLHLSGREEDIFCLQCGYELKPAEREALLEKLAARQRRVPVAA